MRVHLTAGKVASYQHEGAGTQSFLWDDDPFGFGVRAKLFKQCKDLGGTPAIRSEENMLVYRIFGVQCLMPDGSIKDIYGEKFKRDTGQDLFN